MKTIKLKDALKNKYSNDEIQGLEERAELLGEYYIGLQDTVSSEVKNYAQDNNLSYEQIAKQMHTGKSQVSKIIHGDGNHTLNTIVSVALMTGKKPRLTFD